jgi:hypothetical protein
MVAEAQDVMTPEESRETLFPGGVEPAWNDMTPEQQRFKRSEWGKKGGSKPWRKLTKEEVAAHEARVLSADTTARIVFEESADEMARIIIQAAKGAGRFKGLLPKEQAQFALKALEYGIGRPRTTKEEPVTEDTSIAGLSFDVQDPPGETAGAGVNGEVVSGEEES